MGIQGHKPKMGGVVSSHPQQGPHAPMFKVKTKSGWQDFYSGWTLHLIPELHLADPGGVRIKLYINDITPLNLYMYVHTCMEKLEEKGLDLCLVLVWTLVIYC